MERATVLTDNSPEEFGRMLRSAVAHADPESAFVMVETWNEWGEDANIEPSKEHGFGYLSEIARARQMELAAKPRVPSAEEILSWSILSEEELRVAEENEEKPWAGEGNLLESPRGVTGGA